MLDFIIKIIIKWYMRKTPHEELVDMLTLNIMAARRCAYDLRHAADSSDNDFERELYSNRARQWLGIFNPSGVKEYYHDLVHENSSLKRKVEYYVELCKKHNIEVLEEDDKPF